MTGLNYKLQNPQWSKCLIPLSKLICWHSLVWNATHTLHVASQFLFLFWLASTPMESSQQPNPNQTKPIILSLKLTVHSRKAPNACPARMRHQEMTWWAKAHPRSPRRRQPMVSGSVGAALFHFLVFLIITPLLNVITKLHFFVCNAGIVWFWGQFTSVVYWREHPYPKYICTAEPIIPCSQPVMYSTHESHRVWEDNKKNWTPPLWITHLLGIKILLPVPLMRWVRSYCTARPTFECSTSWLQDLKIRMLIFPFF